MANITKLSYTLLKGDKELRAKVAEGCGVTTETVRNWLYSDSPNLTRAAVIAIIRQHTGIPRHLLLEEEEEQGSHY
jgi:hypothetical protein